MRRFRGLLGFGAVRGFLGGFLYGVIFIFGVFITVCEVFIRADGISTDSCSIAPALISST